MNILTLFKNSSFEKVWESLIKDYESSIKEEKYEKFKKSFKKAYDDILLLTPNKNNDIAIIEYSYDYDENDYVYEYLSLYYYKKEDILKNFKIDKNIENNIVLSNLSKEEILKLNSESNYIINYGIELDAWSNIVGCEIYDKSIKKHGIDKCVACILYEMTWFGFDEETVQLKADEINNSSTDTKSYETFDELLKDALEDDYVECIEPTQEEIDERIRKDLILGMENNKILYWQLKDIYNHLKEVK